MDKKKSTLEGQQSPLKKIDYDDTFVVEEPYNLTERFRNLENPLKFIESNNIVGLEHQFRNLRGDLKKEQQSKADFSKAIYKKVISRDNEYNFENELESKERDPIYYFNQKHSDSGDNQKGSEESKREILLRKFKHGNVVSKEEKKERMREEREIPLTFKHVKAIDTPKFDAFREVQFYHLIKGDEEKDYNHSGPPSELDNQTIQIHLQNFKHELIQQSQYHDKISYQFLFDCDRNLQFWRPSNVFKDENKIQEKVLETCAFFDQRNVSIFQMFDFSSHNIEIEDIKQFDKLKTNLKQKMDADKNKDNLQQKYYEAKRRFEEMKELKLKSKNQRLPAKYTDNVAQTIDQMKEKDFEDYFVEDAKNIFDRLVQLNAIRDRIVEEEDGRDFGTMATNIGLEIGKELFKLLMLVLKGEKFIDYSQFIRAENRQEVEKKILELIYLHFAHFQEYEVNGISKVEIIQRYLQEREKNERFYESYAIRNQLPDNQKPSASKKKK